MSRLLFLLPAVPHPGDSGARIRNAGLMRLLSANHEVDAIAFGLPDTEVHLKALTRRCLIVPPPPRRTPLKRIVTMVRSQLPDMAQRLWSAEFARAVRCFVAEGGYHAVQAEGIEMARYLSLVTPQMRIYDAHNAEFLLQRRFGEGASLTVSTMYSRLQWRRLERFERQVVRQSRMTLAVSNHDANQLLALGGPGSDVRVVPNAIDVSSYPVLSHGPQATCNVLFLGKLDFRPNAEALRWLVDHVLTSLHAVRLFAVGGSPPRWLVDAGQHNDRIAVTGYVVDERPYLERCAALLLPLKVGGGSRLKALIAMASGLPIVSTSVGMEGLDAEPGRHYLLADSAAEWVAAIERILTDAPLRAELAHNGRALIEQRYAWSANRALVESAYAWLNR